MEAYNGVGYRAVQRISSSSSSRSAKRHGREHTSLIYYEAMEESRLGVSGAKARAVMGLRCSDPIDQVLCSPFPPTPDLLYFRFSFPLLCCNLC